MIKHFKQSARFLATGVHATSECILLFISRNYLYHFSAYDIYLYWFEKITCLPKLSEEPLCGSNAALKKITIDRLSIYWPNSINAADLPWLYHEIFDPYVVNPSSYDHPMMSLYDRNWVIDAGAAEGYFSIFAAEKVKRGCTILAIEPLSIMHTSLKLTLKNYTYINITVLPCALSNSEGTSTFELNSSHICDSKVSEVAEGALLFNAERVPVTTLDKISGQYGLNGKGLIKMDIEGFEMKALEGAREMLENLKPTLAIAVYHEYENAMKCAKIIMESNSEYKIQFRGCYGYFRPSRPYILFAF